MSKVGYEAFDYCSSIILRLAVTRMNYSSTEIAGFTVLELGNMIASKISLVLYASSHRSGPPP